MSKKGRSYGEVIITQPIFMYLITASILLVVIAVVLLLAYRTYACRKTVVGYWVTDKGSVKVYAMLTGI
jgi:membrane fusion protein